MQGCVKKKNPDGEDGGKKKSCSSALPISVFQSDEVIKHQPALYINDVTAQDFWTPRPQRLLGWRQRKTSS